MKDEQSALLSYKGKKEKKDIYIQK